jgi:hypothetical protein
VPSDYKRTVCNFCIHKVNCEGLRGRLLCGLCPKALLCTMHGDIGSRTCSFVTERWTATLPSKCLLAVSLLPELTDKGDSQSLAVGFRTAQTLLRLENGEGESSELWLCPRCSLPTLAKKVHHDWNAGIGRKHQLSTEYRLVCSICGLDERKVHGVMSAR